MNAVLLLFCYLIFHVETTLTNYLICGCGRCPVRRRRLLNVFRARFEYNWRFCLHLLFVTMLRIATLRTLFDESFLADNHLSKILILTRFQDSRSLCLLIRRRWILLETTGQERIGKHWVLGGVIWGLYHLGLPLFLNGQALFLDSLLLLIFVLFRDQLQIIWIHAHVWIWIVLVLRSKLRLLVTIFLFKTFRSQLVTPYVLLFEFVRGACAIWLGIPSRLDCNFSSQISLIFATSNQIWSFDLLSALIKLENVLSTEQVLIKVSTQFKIHPFLICLILLCFRTYG